jgi:hypothetical protein
LTLLQYYLRDPFEGLTRDRGRENGEKIEGTAKVGIIFIVGSY